MGRCFKDEIAYIPQAITWATAQEVLSLQRAILNTSSRSLFAIGSGGSYTVATFAASCHEKRFGQMSRAVTPLEYRGAGAAIRDAAALMLSAEGKNKDILAAAQSTLIFEHVGLALTLKSNTPLGKFASSSGAMSIQEFEMPWGKDGYLATNSLVAMLILLAKAYCRDTQKDFAALLSHITMAWLAKRRKLISDVISDYQVGTQILVLFGTTSRLTAIDVESKFAEAALGTCQLADYRQFAHGRHLQLSCAQNAVVIAFVSKDDDVLAKATLTLLPKNIRQLILEVPEDDDIAAVQGAIDAILITDVVADILSIDPGQPDVPEFCRAIHQLDSRALIQEAPPLVPIPVARKLKRGVNDATAISRFTESATAYAEKLARSEIKALVCDFDGTFCETDRRFDGLDCLLIDDIERISDYGIPIIFATGRGDSLLGDLRNKIHARCWKNIYIGYYSGSYIAALDEKPTFPAEDPRFNDLLSWLGTIGVYAQIEANPKVDCGQLGLRCGNHASRHEAVTAIKLWIQRHGFLDWRVYCSGHSIDVLSDWAGKRKVVDFVVEKFAVNPETEILRLGDSGDFDGNDFELLCEGLGLSVNTVSSDPANCWNLLPIDKRGVVGTKYYLDHMHVTPNRDAMSLASLFQTAQETGDAK